jgi:hypothetical protein
VEGCAANRAPGNLPYFWEIVFLLPYSSGTCLMQKRILHKEHSELRNSFVYECLDDPQIYYFIFGVEILPFL